VTRLHTCVLCQSLAKPGDAYCKTCVADRVNAATKENPMPSEKTTPVPDELLRELHRITAKHTSSKNGLSDLAELMEKLPAPPALDPVEECAKAFSEPGTNGQFSWGYGECPNGRMRHALLRYRELGCPELQ
jgi:hypothetical protein